MKDKKIIRPERPALGIISSIILEQGSGYGAFSVGQLEYQKTIDYISNQKEHHKVISFQEEYLRFLKTYSMKYDEKHLWE